MNKTYDSTKTQRAPTLSTYPPIASLCPKTVDINSSTATPGPECRRSSDG